MRIIPLVDGKKVCRDCGQAFPPTADYFSMSRGKPSSYCKPCASARAKAHYQQNHERGLQARAEYREAHRGEWSEYFRRYAAENAEHRKAIYQAWRVKNAATVRAKSRGRYRANPGPTREQLARWKQANPEKAALQVLRKNHRRRGAPLDQQATAYTRILKLDPCCYCGAKAARIEIDHIVSLKRGGDGRWDNLTAACRPCNNKKSGRSLLEFLMVRAFG